MNLSANLYRTTSFTSKNSKISRPYSEVKCFTVAFVDEVYWDRQEQELISQIKPGPKDKTTGGGWSVVQSN